MKKALIISLAALLIIPAAWAQRGYGARDCTGPWAPQAPGAAMAPHAPMAGHQGMRGRHGKQGMRGQRGMALMRLAEQLELTDAQIDKLRAMREDHQLAMVDARADVKKAQIRLRTLRRDEAAGEQEMMQAIDAAASVRAQIQKMQYRHKESCRAILTEAQRDMLETLRKDGAGKWHQMRQNWQDRPDSDRQYRGRRFNSDG